MLGFNKVQQRIFLVMAGIIVLLACTFLIREYRNRSDRSKPARSTLIELSEEGNGGKDSDSVDIAGADDTSDSEDVNTAAGSAGETSIRIYITGCVKSPGVIAVPEDCRLSDALELVGGALPDADLTRINLAQRVRDEGMYYIPAAGEEPPDLPADSGGGTDTALSDGKVDINHANQQLLETLNGIGPSRARSIIEYREQNGGFTSIEEIMNVSGIGEKIFQGLKDQIVVK